MSESGTGANEGTSGEMLRHKEEGEMLMLKSGSLRNPRGPCRGGNPWSHEAPASPWFRCARRCQERGRALRWQRLGCLRENNKEKESYLSMSMARGGLCDVCSSLMLLRFLISFLEPEGSDAGGFLAISFKAFIFCGFQACVPPSSTSSPLLK